jgi:aconitate hydratase
LPINNLKSFIFLQVEVYDAAMKYREARSPMIILAGKDYGVGSPRDWVAKGQAMLVIAEL